MLNPVLCTHRTCVGRVIEGEVDMSDVSTLQTQGTSIATQSMTPFNHVHTVQVADIAFTLEDDEVEQVWC